MAQEYIKFNSTSIRQPDAGLGYNFETTYTSDTTRTQIGVLRASPMFTVESFSYEASNLTVAEMSQILKIVAGGNKFTMHYFSPFYGEWRDDVFYVGKGSLSIGTLNHESELYESLSFNIIGINPINMPNITDDSEDSTEVIAQVKTVTPSAIQQTITPDAGYTHLSKVIILPIPYSTESNSAGGTTIVIG